jgi:DNA gyrase/topoisomerase IV subunit A
VIRSAANRLEAATTLTNVLGIDEWQARAVTDLQVGRIAGRERQALASELADLTTRIAELDGS